MEVPCDEASETAATATSKYYSVFKSKYKANIVIEIFYRRKDNELHPTLQLHHKTTVVQIRRTIRMTRRLLEMVREGVYEAQLRETIGRRKCEKRKRDNE